MLQCYLLQFVYRSIYVKCIYIKKKVVQVCLHIWMCKMREKYDFIVPIIRKRKQRFMSWNLKKYLKVTAFSVHVCIYYIIFRLKIPSEISNLSKFIIFWILRWLWKWYLRIHMNFINTFFNYFSVAVQANCTEDFCIPNRHSVWWELIQQHIFYCLNGRKYNKLSFVLHWIKYKSESRVKGSLEKSLSATTSTRLSLSRHRNL